MEKFIILTGVAAPLTMENVNTDMIIPKQFLKTIKRTGLREGLFYEHRFNDQGKEIEDFVLNRSPYHKAKILITEGNFGCGSSREHAPWALLDFGIRCIIALSFADIFRNNCFQNGILPITLPQEDIDRLMDGVERGTNAVLTVDLEAQTITGPDDSSISFDIDPFHKQCLLEGHDNIALTMKKKDKIADFEAQQKQEQPWQWIGQA